MAVLIPCHSAPWPRPFSLHVSCWTDNSVKLVALALGKDWWLPWTRGWDWSPWDCEHSSGARVEIKQAAARQSWDRDALAPPRTPRFDIAPRTGYWLSHGNQWIDRQGRPANVYVFAWHGERERETADYRNAGQWRFLVVSERDLPADRKTITLKKLEPLVPSFGIDSLREAVGNALPERKKQIGTNSAIWIPPVL